MRLTSSHGQYTLCTSQSLYAVSEKWKKRFEIWSVKPGRQFAHFVLRSASVLAPSFCDARTRIDVLQTPCPTDAHDNYEWFARCALDVAGKRVRRTPTSPATDRRKSLPHRRSRSSSTTASGP